MHAFDWCWNQRPSTIERHTHFVSKHMRRLEPIRTTWMKTEQCYKRRRCNHIAACICRHNVQFIKKKICIRLRTVSDRAFWVDHHHHHLILKHMKWVKCHEMPVKTAEKLFTIDKFPTSPLHINITILLTIDQRCNLVLEWVATCNCMGSHRLGNTRNSLVYAVAGKPAVTLLIADISITDNARHATHSILTGHCIISW